MLQSATFCQVNAKYNTLAIEIALMHRNDTPELQHWAVWTTCNLLLQDKEHYKGLLGEDGLGIIAQLTQHQSSYEIQELAAKAMALCQ